MIIDRFSGERGQLAPWRDTSLFTANNVMVQIDGALTCRPALALPWTNFTWASYDFTGKNLWGAGVGSGTDTIGVAPENEHIWFVLHDKLWRWDGVDGVDPYIAHTFSAVPTSNVVSARQGSVTWIASPEEGLYKYSVTTAGSTLTKLSNVVPGKAFSVWQGLEICSGTVAVSATQGAHRIYWSDSPGSWPSATNYNDIGDSGSNITGLYVLRNQLLVTKDDGSWWMVTGELATTDNPDASYSVREVSRTNYPIVRQSSGFVNEQIVAFTPDVAGFPVTYNGSQFTEIRYLVDPDFRGAQVIGGAGIGDLLFQNNGKALLHQSGIWVRLTVPDDSFVVLYPKPGTDTQFYAFIQAPDDDVDRPPKCHLLPAEPLSDPSSTPFNDESGEVTVTFAELISDDVMVQNSDIYIYYRRIAVTAANSGFNVKVVPHRFSTVDGSGTVPPDPAFIQRTTVGTYAAGRYLAVINVNHIPAYSYEVTISNIFGCAIERIGLYPVASGKAKK